MYETKDKRMLILLKYTITQRLDFDKYFSAFPTFNSQDEYNNLIRDRGAFRKNCKDLAEEIAKELSSQINQSIEEIYRFLFKFAVNVLNPIQINVRSILDPTLNRSR